MNKQTTALADVTAAELREAIRAGEVTGPTTGLAAGYAQANVVILPAEFAEEFGEFCRLNPRPCPLVAKTAPGCAEPADVAPGADLRTDVPRYRVFHRGVAEGEQPTDIRHLWRDDLVGFLLGCSFTFENAMLRARLPVRHIDEERNVPMYRTHLECRSAGRFAGPLVVSMRPYTAEQIDSVVKITGRYPQMHGEPLHVGDPAVLGIAELGRPDFGDPVTIRDDELPVFWACGTTPQLAILEAKPEIAITHSPGCMFVMDRSDESFRIG